jgi:hypothetical protein
MRSNSSTVRFLLTILALTALLAVTTPAHSQEDARVVRFTWWAPDAPAVVEVPLPQGVAPGAVHRIEVAAEIRLLGFAIGGGADGDDSATLVLYMSGDDGGALDFQSIDVALNSGVQRRYEIGDLRVAPASAGPGGLSFERSLSVPAAGLYQAVALRNDAQADIIIESVEYLPAGWLTGELLLAVGDDASESLSLLEATFTPTAEPGGDRAHAGPPLVRGFTTAAAKEVGVKLRPREVAVLVWTNRAFHARDTPASFAVRPVVVYRLASEPGSLRLGVPVLVRAER